MSESLTTVANVCLIALVIAITITVLLGLIAINACLIDFIWGDE